MKQFDSENLNIKIAALEQDLSTSRRIGMNNQAKNHIQNAFENLFEQMELFAAQNFISYDIKSAKKKLDKIMVQDDKKNPIDEFDKLLSDFKNDKEEITKILIKTQMQNNPDTPEAKIYSIAQSLEARFDGNPLTDKYFEVFSTLLAQMAQLAKQKSIVYDIESDKAQLEKIRQMYRGSDLYDGEDLDPKIKSQSIAFKNFFGEVKAKFEKISTPPSVAEQALAQTPPRTFMPRAAPVDINSTPVPVKEGPRTVAQQKIIDACNAEIMACLIKRQKSLATYVEGPYSLFKEVAQNLSQFFNVAGNRNEQYIGMKLLIQKAKVMQEKGELIDIEAIVADIRKENKTKEHSINLDKAFNLTSSGLNKKAPSQFQRLKEEINDIIENSAVSLPKKHTRYSN